MKTLRTLLALLLSMAIIADALAQQPSDETVRPRANVALPDWPSSSFPDTITAAPQTIAAKPVQYDTNVVPASYSAPSTDTPPISAAEPERRRTLAPREDSGAERRARTRPSSPSELFSSFGLRFDSIFPTLAALALVLGLFFLCIWGLRRGAKKATKPLPPEVVSVVGRAEISPKQFAEMLRIGNKLVLVALTPDGPAPISEVTDPAEVDRLLGLCQQSAPNSTSRDFERMFRDLEKERTPDHFLGAESPVISVAPPTGGFRPRGGYARG